MWGDENGLWSPRVTGSGKGTEGSNLLKTISKTPKGQQVVPRTVRGEEGSRVRRRPHGRGQGAWVRPLLLSQGPRGRRPCSRVPAWNRHARKVTAPAFNTASMSPAPCWLRGPGWKLLLRASVLSSVKGARSRV